MNDKAIKSMEEQDALSKSRGILTGRFLVFSYADGAAHYLITKENTKTVRIEHIRLGGDDWMIPEYGAGTNIPKDHALKNLHRRDGLNAMFSNADQAREDFWNNQVIGSILHYREGNETFVRGKVVQDGTGKVGFKKIGLVGNWRKWDLPFRTRSGSVTEGGYHAKQVAEGVWCQPHETDIYESPKFNRARCLMDPSTLPMINLTVPDMTPEEFNKSLLHLALDTVKQMVEERDNDNPTVTIQAIINKLQAHLK
jgi:hypothetical protein